MENTIRTFDAGQKLIRKHEMATAVYLIKSGEVVVYDLLDDGKKVEIARLGKGQILGELASLQKRPHSLYVEATEKTQAVVINVETFKSKIKSSDPLVQALIKVLIDRVKGADEKLLMAKSQDVYFDGDH